MQKVIFKFLIISVFTLFSSTTFGSIEATESELIKADSLYQNRQFTQASKIYNKIFESGFYSPSMLLKMARMAEGQSQFSKSIFYLEKYYQATANEKILDHIETVAEENNLEGFNYGFEFYLNHYYKKYRTSLTIGVTALLVLLLVYFIKERNNKKLQWSFFTPIVIISLFIAFFNNYKGITFAISTNHPSMFMTGPSAGSDVEMVIRKATKVPVKEEVDIWTKTLIEDKEGYLKSDDLKKL